MRLLNWICRQDYGMTWAQFRALPQEECDRLVHERTWRTWRLLFLTFMVAFAALALGLLAALITAILF